ncbi:hypothetical protein B0H14DRAFT_2599321 [Mycena olivaceomarginata]|nr:hypothetical protein B0H14DRAFT_2599321 [Mycena olivaceomarginata]
MTDLVQVQLVELPPGPKKQTQKSLNIFYDAPAGNRTPICKKHELIELALGRCTTHNQRFSQLFPNLASSILAPSSGNQKSCTSLFMRQRGIEPRLAVILFSCRLNWPLPSAAALRRSDELRSKTHRDPFQSSVAFAFCRKKKLVQARHQRGIEPRLAAPPSVYAVYLRPSDEFGGKLVTSIHFKLLLHRCNIYHNPQVVRSNLLVLSFKNRLPLGGEFTSRESNPKSSATLILLGWWVYHTPLGFLLSGYLSRGAAVPQAVRPLQVYPVLEELFSPHRHSLPVSKPNFSPSPTSRTAQFLVPAHLLPNKTNKQKTSILL